MSRLGGNVVTGSGSLMPCFGALESLELLSETWCRSRVPANARKLILGLSISLSARHLTAGKKASQYLRCGARRMVSRPFLSAQSLPAAICASPWLCDPRPPASKSCTVCASFAAVLDALGQLPLPPPQIAFTHEHCCARTYPGRDPIFLAGGTRCMKRKKRKRAWLALRLEWT